VTICDISGLHWIPSDSGRFWRIPAEHVGECKVLVYADLFDPLSVEAIALVLTAVSCFFFNFFQSTAEI
jgi:hypothetical protein